MDLNTGYRATGTLKFTDVDGRAAIVDGVPEWASSNPGVVTVEPAADGLTAVVFAAGSGSSTITVVCDADMSTGRREITTSDTINVTAKEAVAVGIEWGAPSA